jgi:4-hydroxybenzoate polyprenyltransferase
MQKLEEKTISSSPCRFGKPTATFAEWAEMIKVEHTVFALPFALSGMVLASPVIPQVSIWFWTILAFIGARSAAMSLNRVIDAKIDALNPRTNTRAIPQGRIKSATALFFALASFAVMLFAASHLPELCLWLAPIAIFWLSFYSYSKRFTYFCHLFLGIALGGAALGGWIAASGSLAEAAPWLLALAVTTWVTGFDIIYALQDEGFDRNHKLHSLPAAFGIQNSLNISSALHVVTVAALIAVGALLSLGIIYWVGILIVACMLIFEHTLVKANDLSRINAAFFNINGFVSIACFATILVDKLLSWAN